MQTVNKFTDNKGTDLLSAIYKIEIRNEEKISESDRIFCEEEQEKLYHSLDQMDLWYKKFVEEATKYNESHKITYKTNGKIKIHEPYRYHYDFVNFYYTDFEFKPFDNINKLVELNYRALNAFAKSIIGYFNKTYNVSVPYPKIDEETLQMGFRPVYQSYVDLVIEHLGGGSFRNKAEEELLKRFHKVVKPGTWCKVQPELKKDKISFPDIIRFEDFWTDRNKVHYNYRNDLEDFCAGIAFGSNNSLTGCSMIMYGFNDDNVDTTKSYRLKTGNADEMKFFKNGRIDVKFKDAQTARSCFCKLKLDTI